MLASVKSSGPDSGIVHRAGERDQRAVAITFLVLSKEKLFQYIFPDQVWINIRAFVDNLARLKMWIDRDASATVFGGKQTHGFWEAIFEFGHKPHWTKSDALRLEHH